MRVYARICTSGSGCRSLLLLVLSVCLCGYIQRLCIYGVRWSLYCLQRTHSRNRVKYTYFDVISSHATTIRLMERAEVSTDTEQKKYIYKVKKKSVTQQNQYKFISSRFLSFCSHSISLVPSLTLYLFGFLFLLFLLSLLLVVVVFFIRFRLIVHKKH